jgi:hypothetical protein
MTENSSYGILVEDWDIFEILCEWELLVDELSEKEVALYEWKEIYQIKALEIENNTDFKAIYGKNNADIRKQHVKMELSEWDKTITDLQFSIDWIGRRISFLRELIKVKRTLLEVKGNETD